MLTKILAIVGGSGDGSLGPVNSNKDVTSCHEPDVPNLPPVFQENYQEGSL